METQKMIFCNFFPYILKENLKQDDNSRIGKNNSSDRTDNSIKIINHGLMHGLMKLSKKDSKIAIKNLNGIVVMKNTLQYIIKLFSSVHLECV